MILISFTASYWAISHKQNQEESIEQSYQSYCLELEAEIEAMKFLG